MKTRNTIFTTILVLFGSFVVSPRVQAFLPPPVPDGGYLNNNIAEGTQALFKLTTGEPSRGEYRPKLVAGTNDYSYRVRYRNKSRPWSQDQAAIIQKVSAHLQMNKTSQLMANSR